MDVFYSTPAFSFGPSIGLENNVAHIEDLLKSQNKPHVTKSVFTQH